jgi:predicted alpha/beta superfamily hydrolase
MDGEDGLVFGRRKFLASSVGLTTALGVSGFTGAFARADNAGFRKMETPWPLRDSEAFEIESKAVGDTMAVGVWHAPERFLAKPGEAMPPLDIVYVLDGSWALGIVAGIAMLQYVDLIHPGFRPILLVGVDYPVGRTNARARDYTMKGAVSASVQKAMSYMPETTPGGADKFLAFLEEELDPWIRSKYNVSDRPAGILGDSFGGTFTFYAFQKQSKLFDRYWLGSPGIHATDIDHVAQFAARLKGKLVHPTKMFLSMGSLEIDGGNENYEDMGRQFNRVLSALNQTPNSGLEWKSKIYDGYTHTSVLAPAVNDALLYLYGK